MIMGHSSLTGHVHPDHYGGTGEIASVFPGAQILARHPRN